MRSMPSYDLYSPREIARAVGVPVAQVVAALGHDGFVGHDEAVRIGRTLVGAPVRRTSSLFSIFVVAPSSARPKGLPLALSSTLHAGIVAAAVFVTTLGLAPSATTLQSYEAPDEQLHLVFMAAPGPGGGGGGGGLLQKPLPPKAKREGRRAVSSPIPARVPPRPIEPVATPPEPPPPPPLNAEALPVVVAPIVQAPADDRDRIGVLEQARSEAESHGPGKGGGVGTGTGTGIGEGDGSGVGAGSGGGIGGGPYRPGAGIEPPRLLREIKADYTDEARRRGVEGDVVFEIVVRRDGSVGELRTLQRLGAGLDERAAQAVRQWRFAPARRRGTPVDVIVEVAVEFKLR